MGVPEIEAFLSHLVQEGDVSASTQNQAFNAILFLYRNLLKIELAAPIHALRAKRAQRLPIVLSKSEVSQLLCEMQGLHLLMARLLEAGYDIHTVQKLLGHKDVKTSMICTHVLNRGPKAMRNPLDE